MDDANLLGAQSNADDITYEELEWMLRGRFGSPDQEEKFQTEFRARRMGREESMQALYADSTRFMALANQKDDLSLNRIRPRLLLDHVELEIKVREREPPDLQAAYKPAIWLETLKKASSARDVETAPIPKEAAKPSKAIKAVES